MRAGVGAEFPHHDRFLSVEAPRALLPSPSASDRPSAHSQTNPGHPQSAHLYPARANIGRLFYDLRRALGISPEHLAAQLFTTPATIVALEAGQFEYLPPWSETVRIVTAYTARAGIDGRPVLGAIAGVLSGAGLSSRNDAAMLAASGGALRQPMIGDIVTDGFILEDQEHRLALPAPIEQAPGPQPAAVHRNKERHANRFPVGQWLQAGSKLANGAKRLPAGALKQVRQRPERALYAVSLPLAVLLLLLNTSALETAFSQVPRPVARLAQDVRQFFQEKFAPVHEGLRWIDVDDPRRRRGDKLR